MIPLPTRRSLSSAARSVARISVIVLSVGIAANLALQGLVVGADPDAMWFYVTDRALLFLIGATITGLAFGLIWGVLGRLSWAVASIFSVVLVTGFASNEKLRVRREPLYPSDLSFADNAGFLAGMTSADRALGVMAALSSIWIICVMVGRLVRASSRADLLHVRHETSTRVMLVVLSVSALVHSAQFNAPGNVTRALYDSSGALWASANQPRNYVLNGFVGGFLFNSNVTAMQSPHGYNRQRIARVADKYAADAALINRTRDPSALEDTNVVVILSEAFTDPTRLDGFTLNEDPIPYTRAAMKDLPRGTALAQKMGAGTANMEFQALTGMSTALFDPRMDTPYQMLVPKREGFPSVVGYFESLGFETTAIHPYEPNMYQRQHVYPNFGFDTFIHRGSMEFNEQIEDNNLISDKSTFDQLLHELSASEKRLFANVVTMQNHYAYLDKYASPIGVRGISTDERQEALGTYARGLRYSDAAIEYLMERLSSLPERTVVIFYGDHLPAAYPPEVLAQNSDRTLHETVLFFWDSKKSLPSRELPTSSPVFFLPMLFELIDAPVPPMFALLDHVRRRVSALEHGMWIDATDGSTDVAPLANAQTRQVIDDYRLVQFDMAVGDKAIAERMLPGSVQASAAQ